MADVAEAENHAVRITDILAVDTLAPVEISGALAGETCMEKAVGIAAMVKTAHLPMQKIAEQLEKDRSSHQSCCCRSRSSYGFTWSNDNTGNQTSACYP